MISIIVPIYRVECYLRRCIDSLLAQTYKDLEIILVDDGSPDNSSLICDEYAMKDHRIRVIHQGNTGLSAARNAGMKVASGTYIGFVDSDDYVEPRMYENLIRIIEANNADIAMCGCRIVAESSEIIGNDIFEENAVYKIDEIISRFVLTLKTASWNKLYRSSSVKGSQFPSGRIHGEDLVFIMSVLAPTTTLATTSYVGYNYIKRENSITTGIFKQSSFDEVWCKDEAYRLMSEKFPVFEREVLLWQLRSRMNLIRKMTKSGDPFLYTKQEEYRCWINANKNRFKCIPRKWKIEIILLLHFKFVYNWLVVMFGIH